MNDSTERFLHILDELVYAKVIPNVSSIAKVCPTIYVQKITNMKNKKNKVTTEMLVDLLKAFPNINMNWVLGEQGDMFLGGETPAVHHIEKTYNAEKDTEIMKMLLDERERNSKKDDQILALINFVTSKLTPNDQPRDKDEVL